MVQVEPPSWLCQRAGAEGGGHQSEEFTPAEARDHRAKSSIFSQLKTFS